MKEFELTLFFLCVSVGLLAFVIATDLKSNPVVLFTVFANFVFQLALLFYQSRR